MKTIKAETKVLDYIDNVFVIPGQYENGQLYIGLYDTKTQELYTDLTTNIDIPVLPGSVYIETGTEKEKFANEQKHMFIRTDKTVKQGFNTYRLYYFIRTW